MSGSHMAGAGNLFFFFSREDGEEGPRTLDRDVVVPKVAVALFFLAVAAFVLFLAKRVWKGILKTRRRRRRRTARRW